MRHAIWALISAAALVSPAAIVADEHTTTTCEAADVQARIGEASNGDTVVVHADTCDWVDGVVIDKSITLSGENVVVRDRTGTDYQQVPIWVDAIAGMHVRITGFTFQNTDNWDSAGMVRIDGTDASFRMDHCRFEYTSTPPDGKTKMRAFFVTGKVYGVIDHCTLSNGGYLIDDDIDESWARPLAFGSADAVFLEDNTFTGLGDNYDMGDAENGARLVVRYNRFDGGLIGNHGMDSVPRSCLQMEIYGNRLSWAGTNKMWCAIGFRGGTGLLFDNEISGYDIPIRVTNYRSCCDAGAACTPSPQPAFPTCNGDSDLDGNTEPKSVYKGWPCKDQIGRGPNQSSEPIYEWNNTFDGANAEIAVTNTWSGCVDPQPSDHIQKDRDYFSDRFRPRYVPFRYPHPLTLSDYSGNRQLALKSSSAAGQITLSWSAVEGTTSYQIKRSGSQGWIDAGSTTEVSYAEAVPADGTVYYVKAIAGDALLAAEGILFDGSSSGRGGCGVWLPGQALVGPVVFLLLAAGAAWIRRRRR